MRLVRISPCLNNYSSAASLEGRQILHRGVLLFTHRCPCTFLTLCVPPFLAYFGLSHTKKMCAKMAAAAAAATATYHGAFFFFVTSPNRRHYRALFPARHGWFSSVGVFCSHEEAFFAGYRGSFPFRRQMDCTSRFAAGGVGGTRPQREEA